MESPANFYRKEVALPHGWYVFGATTVLRAK
jgi:hypothetical protein